MARRGDRARRRGAPISKPSNQRSPLARRLSPPFSAVSLHALFSSHDKPCPPPYRHFCQAALRQRDALRGAAAELEAHLDGVRTFCAVASPELEEVERAAELRLQHLRRCEALAPESDTVVALRPALVVALLDAGEAGEARQTDHPTSPPRPPPPRALAHTFWLALALYLFG